MSRIAALLMTLVLVASAALIALNWPALTAVAPVNLGVTQVDVSLGSAAMGWLALVAILFFADQASTAWGSWRRTRRADHEITRLRALADAAETSRFEDLRQLMVTEFRRVHARLGPEHTTELVVDESGSGPALPARSGFFSRRTGV